MQWPAHLSSGRILALLFTSACLCACAGNQRVGEPFSRVPELDTQNLILGQQVFMQQCHQCHPNGEGGIAPALNPVPAPQFLIAFQVRNGLGAMPAFPESVISGGELDALTDYVIALRRAAR